MKDYILIYITCPTRKVAEQLAHSLLQQRLTACANILPGLQSIYHWQGNIQHETEVLMLLKTRSSHFNAICEQVKKQHPYEVPEIIAVPIVAGSKDYLNWVKEETNDAEGMV